jgi:GNAT superfamily N-acetyltransferase
MVQRGCWPAHATSIIEPMKIRPAVAEDALAIAVVHLRSWQAAYQGLVPQDFLDGLDVSHRRLAWQRILGETEWPRVGTFVVEIDKNVVGFVNVGPTRDRDEDPATVGEVTAIYVLGEAWGTGAGRRLMAAAVDSLKEAGFEQATLWVLDTNHRTRRFYETGGWRPDGAVKRDDLRGFPLTEVRYRRLFS